MCWCGGFFNSVVLFLLLIQPILPTAIDTDSLMYSVRKKLVNFIRFAGKNVLKMCMRITNLSILVQCTDRQTEREGSGRENGKDRDTDTEGLSSLPEILYEYIENWN